MTSSTALSPLCWELEKKRGREREACHKWDTDGSHGDAVGVQWLLRAFLMWQHWKYCRHQSYKLLGKLFLTMDSSSVEFSSAVSSKKARPRHSRFDSLIQRSPIASTWRFLHWDCGKRESQPFLMWWRRYLETLHAAVLWMRTWSPAEAPLQMHQGPFPLFFWKCKF